MLRGALFLARSDLRHALRQRETWIWTFAMPLVFFYFFSTIQGGSGSSAEVRDELTLVVPDAGGLLVDELERRLMAEDFDVRRTAQLDPQLERPTRVLEVPLGFSERVLQGETSKLRLSRTGGGNAAELDRFRVSRAAYGVLADVVVSAARGDEQSAAAYGALAQWPRALTLESRPAGERRVVPSGREQSIPGTLVMFTLVLLLTSGAVGVVIERRQGLLRRLASSPLSPGSIVLGKWAGVLALGLIQIAYGMAAGTWIFGLAWGPDLAWVLLVLLAWAAFVASLALLLSSLARTEGQVIGIGVLSSNVLAALGGCWWPIEVTPLWMQSLARALPTGRVMDALHALMLFQSGPTGAWSALAYLLFGALALGLLAARRFRFE